MSYQVVGLLGRGAMAVVELAVRDDGTRVARKRVSLVGSGHDIDAARRRLRREAEIVRDLHHPGIVAVLDVEDDGADVVLVMPALACSLAERVGTAGPLPPGEVVAVGRRLLEALATAHRSGVVHRDIKPANVLFSADGAPALADFGVATSRDVTAGLTVAGTVVGTPSWMAPEQARGEPVGPAADVFALGATLLFAATGTGPYGPGPPDAQLARAASGRVVRIPPEVPTALRAPLAAMLDPLASRRPSAAAVLGGLDGTARQARPAGLRAARTGRSRTRRALRRVLLGSDGRQGPEDNYVRGRWLDVQQQRANLRSDRARSCLLVPHRGDGWRRPVAVAVAAGCATLGAAAAGYVIAGTGATRPAGTGATRPAGSGRPAPIAPAACTPQVYRACGAPAAPHTDGVTCLPGWFDLDGVAANGCEAHSDYRAGTTLDTSVRANLVPAGSIDTFTTRVSGHLLSLCSGALHLELTAPAGVADRIQVGSGRTVIASATSVDGQPATANVAKPGCFGSHSETLTLTVTDTVGASGADFTLRRSGGW